MKACGQAGREVRPKEQRELGASRLIGYTAGVFDLFHIGHLNLFRNARGQCDLLVVGVTTDDLAERVRGSRPIISLVERMEIVQHVRYVDDAVPQETTDKLVAWQAIKFDVLFAGDNVRGSAEWDAVEHSMAAVGVRVVYLPATYVRSGELLSRGLCDLVAD